MPAILQFDNYGTLSILPSSFEFGIIHNTQVFTSPLNGQTQTSEMPGARWRVRMAFEELIEADIRELMAFMVELRGMGNRFLMYDLSHPTPLLAVTGTLTISGTPTAANEITIAGMTGADFSPGDMISINRAGSPTDASDVELKMIIRKSGSPNDYNIEPPLRSQPLSVYGGDTIDYDKARASFMLTSDTQTNWSATGKVPLASLDIEGIEVFSYG